MEEVLKHYGVLGMKWGVHRYRNDPDKLRKHYNKASNKLFKYNKKYWKKQLKADKKFAKAERKLNGLFGNPKKGEIAFRKAEKAQYRANKIIYRGEKWYKAMDKNFGTKYIKSVDPDAIELGKYFTERLQSSNAALYGKSFYNRVNG